MSTAIDRRPRCPNCERLTILYQKRTNTYMCRACGHAWPAPPPEKDKVPA